MSRIFGESSTIVYTVKQKQRGRIREYKKSLSKSEHRIEYKADPQRRCQNRTRFLK